MIILNYCGPLNAELEMLKVDLANVADPLPVAQMYCITRIRAVGKRSASILWVKGR